jgi:hypothetical protein
VSNAKLSANDANSTVVVEEDEPDVKIAKNIAIKVLTSQNITSKDDGYSSKLGEVTDDILRNFNNYDDDIKMSGLQQLDDLSNSFIKGKFIDQVNAFIKLYSAKYQHEQQLAQAKEIASAANKAIALQAIGAGIVSFAIFVMILVLLRIEKNTRQLIQEDNTYDKKDKIILLGFIGTGFILSMLIGLGSGALFGGSSSDFNATAEVRPMFVGSSVSNVTDINTTEMYASEGNTTTEERDYTDNQISDADLKYYFNFMHGGPEAPQEDVIIKHNSKGIKIVCNLDMTICKTEQEIIDFSRSAANGEGD